MDENKEIEKKPEASDAEESEEIQGGTGAVTTSSKTTSDRKWWEIPMWMLAAAILTAMISAGIFSVRANSYLSNNPPRITWETVHEVAGDTFTAYQWQQMDSAESNRWVDIETDLGSNMFYVNVYGSFMYDEELATIRMYYSSFKKEYSLSSWSWYGKSDCGCENCECKGEWA